MFSKMRSNQWRYKPAGNTSWLGKFSHWSNPRSTHPDVNPIECIQLRIVVPKFGDRSYAFATEVIDTALVKPSEIVMNATHPYRLFSKNTEAIRKPAGRKWAIRFYHYNLALGYIHDLTNYWKWFPCQHSAYHLSFEQIISDSSEKKRKRK